MDLFIFLGGLAGLVVLWFGHFGISIVRPGSRFHWLGNPEGPHEVQAIPLGLSAPPCAHSIVNIDIHLKPSLR